MNQFPINPDPLLVPEAAAVYISRDQRSMANDRAKNEGPPYLKVGRLVRYRKSALDAYLKRCEVTHPGQSSILDQGDLKARVAAEMHVSPEIAQRHINNARKVLRLVER